MYPKPKAEIITQPVIALTISAEQAADLHKLLGAIAGGSDARTRTFTPVYYALQELKERLPDPASLGDSRITL
jgi:hypothetical protein